jgi:hypothetical protein
VDTRIVGKDSNSGLTIIYYTLIVRFIFYIACITQGKILIGLMTFELMLLPFEIFAIRLIASDLSQIVKKLQDLSKYKSSKNQMVVSKQQAKQSTPPVPNMDAQPPTIQNSVPIPDMNAQPPIL